MLKPLRVHLLDEMQNAPFVSPASLERLPVTLVDSQTEAQLIVGRKRSMFDLGAALPDKQYLLWTHEPFFDVTATWREPNFFPPPVKDRNLYVFNVHNGLVYTDNFYLAPSNGKLRNITGPAGLNVPFADKTISFAATYKRARCIVAGEDRSLNAARCDLAEALQARGQCRIIGRDWPEGMAESESRFENRPRAKTEFLKQSNFNLCYENCVADYYITEKLWESIFGGCLPIYYSNDTVYQIFPRNSFIDGRSFPDPEALLAFINAMPFEEYQRRINLCRRVFNIVVQEKYRDTSRERSLRRLSRFLETLGSASKRVGRVQRGAA